MKTVLDKGQDFLNNHSPKIVGAALLGGVVKVGLVFGTGGLAVVLVVSILLIDFDWEAL